MNCNIVSILVDYLPPEMVENRPYTTTMDNWCLGVLIYELTIGAAPFHEDKDPKTFDRIQRVDFKFPHRIDKSLRHLISMLLVKEPERRLALKEVSRIAKIF